MTKIASHVSAFEIFFFYRKGFEKWSLISTAFLLFIFHRMYNVKIPRTTLSLALVYFYQPANIHMKIKFNLLKPFQGNEMRCCWLCVLSCKKLQRKFKILFRFFRKKKIMWRKIRGCESEEKGEKTAFPCFRYVTTTTTSSTCFAYLLKVCFWIFSKLSRYSSSSLCAST